MQLQGVDVSKNRDGVAISVGASATDVLISDEFACPAAHSRSGLMIMIEYTASITNGITARLQQAVRSSTGTTQWLDIPNSRAQATVVTNASAAWTTIRMHPDVDLDAAQMPLTNRLRVVANSGASDSASILRVTAFIADLPARLQGAIRSI